MSERTTLLAIEDCPSMRRAIERAFSPDEYMMLTACDATSGIAAFEKSSPKAVILDLRLPDISGEEVCRQCVSRAPGIPIIVLTAEDGIDTKVKLFEMGAVDYVTKPFSPRELVARVDRAIRIFNPPGTPAAAVGAAESARFSDVEVEFASRHVMRAGAPVTLTAQEFRLLRHLLENPNVVFSRAELLERVWGYNSYPCTRTVDIHVLRLRQKLEIDPANPRHFITIHGEGYRFIPDIKPN